MLDLSCITVSGAHPRRGHRRRPGHQARRHPGLDRPSLPKAVPPYSPATSAARLRNQAGRRRKAYPGSTAARPSRSRLRPWQRVDRDDLNVTPDQCWCSRTPARRAARHARMGHAADSEKALQAGVRDMVRISDARMSGTATAPASCTSRRKALSAARWPSCGPATKSRWTSRRKITRRRRRRARAPPRRVDNSRRRIFCAATARCIPSMSAKPTRAAISIFSRGTQRYRRAGD